MRTSPRPEAPASQQSGRRQCHSATLSVVEVTDDEYRNFARFRSQLRAFLREADLVARSVGLTPAQHELLLQVRGRDAPPSVGELGELLSLAVSTTHELVKRAEANGLVKLTVDPADARRSLVHLTAPGRTKLTTLYEHSYERLEKARLEVLVHLKDATRSARR
jgi:DNA-binding MarR family transcriptional regulator